MNEENFIKIYADDPELEDKLDGVVQAVNEQIKEMRKNASAIARQQMAIDLLNWLSGKFPIIWGPSMVKAIRMAADKDND